MVLCSNCGHLQIWEGEQKKAQEEKRQEELRAQYLKEQEIYLSKELLGKGNHLTSCKSLLQAL